MSALSLASPFPIFTNIDGNPLEDGYIYVGTAGLNPETNPIQAYWDAALTVPAVQPIRTLGGYPSHSGAAARIYVNANDCSMLVKNKNGSLIFSALNQTSAVPSGTITFVQAGASAVERILEEKIREQYVTPEDFGAIGDDATDDHDAIQAAFDSGKSVRLVSAYYTVSTLTLPENTVVFGDGKRSAIRCNGNMTALSLTGTSGTRKNSLVLRDFKIRRTGGVTGSPTRHPVEITYADDCRIENLIIDGASSTYPGSLICRATRNIKVVGCDFINGASLFLSSSDDTTSGGWGENNVISNCRVTGSGTVGQGFNAIYNKNLMFDNCVASGIGSTYGCGFLLEYEIQGAVLNNCVSYGNVRSGFYLEGNVAYGVKNVSMNNCIAYSNGEAGITCDANFINVAVNGGAYFSNTGTFVGGSGHGMHFSENSGVSINGALIHSNAAAGVAWVSNPYKASITGNQIRDNGGYGIYFTGTPSLVDIIGNTINNNTAGTVAGWLETAGTWDSGPWVSWTPSWYKNDNATALTVSAQSAYYKREGKTVRYSIRATFSGTPDTGTYFSLPIEGAWADGSTSDDAQRPRGVAYGTVTAFSGVSGVYDNDRLRVLTTAAGDTTLHVQGSYEIA